MNPELKTKIGKILRGAIIAAAATGSVYLLEGLSVVDFGKWTPVVQGILGVLINAVKVMK